MHGISEGTIFETLAELQMWLKDYAVKYHRTFKVEKSNFKVRYTVRCGEYKNHCSWVVRVRSVKGGPQWKITSSVFDHRCSGKDIDDAGVKDDHRQLTSKFIAQRFSTSIKILPTYPIKALIEMAKEVFGYTVKYKKAWKAKQATFEILYGGWGESYNRLHMLLKGWQQQIQTLAELHEGQLDRGPPSAGAKIYIIGSPAHNADQHSRP